MKEELIKEYEMYCNYIDEDNTHSMEHDYYKNSLMHFMKWLADGFIFFDKLV